MNYAKLCENFMFERGRPIAARLQSALALLERLREYPSLDLEHHTAATGSSGLKSHETYGDRAHERHALQALNKNHGRRSSNLGAWGPPLLDLLAKEGFGDATDAGRQKLIDQAQSFFAARLKKLINEEPLTVALRNRSAEAVIREVLQQADAKGKSGDVAQYLVGAKLQLRLNWDVPVAPANSGDRRSHSDPNAKPGDFCRNQTVFEVAVGMPDEKHIRQAAAAVEDPDAEMWLIVRKDRLQFWQKELELAEVDLRRVVLVGIETFVGQNISELAEFSSKKRSEQLKLLFRIYNEKWAKKVGSRGIEIELK